jgi:preprotein translocase subunit SecA
MIGILNKTITKIFGKKSDRDLKEITPVVTKVKDEFEKLKNISIDELRGKTDIFKSRIAAHVKETQDEIKALENEAEENPDIDIQRKEDIYRKVDELKKEINKLTSKRKKYCSRFYPRHLRW